MSNDAVNQWIDALRSGAYPQTHGVLHNDEGYCCLGVACDLAIKAGLDIEVSSEPRSYTRSEEVVTYDDEKYSLPPAVRDWLGLRRSDGSFFGPRPNDGLATRNDARNTFAQIADVIELRPDGLFDVTDEDR